MKRSASPPASREPNVLPQITSTVERAALGEFCLPGETPPSRLVGLDIHEISQAIMRLVLEDPALKDEGSGAGRGLHSSVGGEGRGLLVVPININSEAFLASVAYDGGGYNVRASRIGKGGFVFGDDNLAFGRWNALVAHDEEGNVIDIFPGHGGEIIPGRLHDHIERFRGNINNHERLPVQMDIDVSMACPSNCTFCFSAPYRAAGGRHKLMKKEVVLEVIRQFAGMGVKVVRFDGGGDPLTHPGILEAITCSYGLGMRTAVLTAGDLLNERQFETFVDCGTYVRVSLNAGTDGTRLSLHQPNNSGMSLSRILANVEKLSALRRESFGGLARRKMLLGATSMIHPENGQETFQIARNAKDAGFDHISFRVILGKDHRVRFTREMREKVEDDFRRIRAELVDDNFVAFTPTRNLTDGGYVPSESFDVCRSCTHRVLIEVGDSHGSAANVPCGRYRGHGFLGAERPGESFVMGQYDETTEAAAVWMSPRMRRMVEGFPLRCGDCIDKSANIFFSRITSALKACGGARFIRLQAGQ